MVHPDIEFKFGMTSYDKIHQLYNNPPDKWRRRVCMCDKKVTAEQYHAEYDYRRHTYFCGRCGNQYAWTLFECMECEQINIKDFVHPAFCKIHPFCWEHLDRELGIPECGCSELSTDVRWDEVIEPWTHYNLPAPDITDFDPFAPLSFF